MKLDLHGNTVHAGWKVFTEHVAECYFSNIKTTEIITGHGKIATDIGFLSTYSPSAAY